MHNSLCLVVNKVELHNAVDTSLSEMSYKKNNAFRLSVLNSIIINIKFDTIPITTIDA